MENRKAYHDYFIEGDYIAGMILVGSEVKALRDNKASMSGAFVYIKDDEVFVRNLHIGNFELAVTPHENLRERKLLLNASEIAKCKEWLKVKGNTIVPLSIFVMNNVFKLKIGLAKGKNHRDKREDIKKRDIERETNRKF